MIPYKWKFWKHKKPATKPKPESAELTLDVAIKGHDEFMAKMQEMEEAIESFGAACEVASEKADGVFDKLEISYHTYNKPE